MHYVSIRVLRNVVLCKFGRNDVPGLRKDQKNFWFSASQSWDLYMWGEKTLARNFLPVSDDQILLHSCVLKNFRLLFSLPQFLRLRSEEDFDNKCRKLSYISGWIFQKVLAEIVQKDLTLSQKALISNRRNLGLFAPTSMRFPSKDSKSKDLSF